MKAALRQWLLRYCTRLAAELLVSANRKLRRTNAMSSYLFLWNPSKDTRSFKHYSQIMAEASAGKAYVTRWICPSRRPRPGDVAYLQRTGPKDNGLFACGVVVRGAFKRDDGIQVVQLSLDRFLSLGAEIPRAEILSRADFSGKWMPMASGNVIPEPIEAAIKVLWPKP